MSYFNDNDKAIQWLTTCNPLLGNQFPVKMIAQGRGHKVETVIKNLLEGNTP